MSVAPQHRGVHVLGSTHTSWGQSRADDGQSPHYRRAAWAWAPVEGGAEPAQPRVCRSAHRGSPAMTQGGQGCGGHGPGAGLDLVLGCQGAGDGGTSQGLSLVAHRQPSHPRLHSRVPAPGERQELLSQPGKARRAQRGAPHAPFKPGSQPLGHPQHPLQTLAPSPLPWACWSQTLGNSSRGNMLVAWGQDLPSHPSRPPTAAPAPPCAQALCLTCPILRPLQQAAGGPGACSAGKEESSRRWDVGFYFILSKYL